MLKRVLVTRKLPGTALNFLSKYYQVDIHGGPHPIPSDILSEKIKGYDALICLLNDKIDASVLEAGGNLKIVSCYSAGYDNVDVERATKLGIVVTNTPGILTETTADLTWGLLLSTARRIPESDRFTREGGFTGWDPFLMLGMDIYGKTLGIVGFGRIGKAVAKRALGFNMKILYYSPGQEGDGGIPGAKNVSFDTLLAESDFISIHTPLTPKTKKMFGTEQFKLMKRSSILINTSRGSIIDEKALTDAIKNGLITAAGLDVYEYEPEITEELKTMNNCVLLPHIGSATVTTRSRMAMLAVENVDKLLSGSFPLYTVNSEVKETGAFKRRNELIY